MFPKALLQKRRRRGMRGMSDYRASGSPMLMQRNMR
jgi:hypothetical protein